MRFGGVGEGEIRGKIVPKLGQTLFFLGNPMTVNCEERLESSQSLLSEIVVLEAPSFTEFFVIQERVSGFPEQGADLRGSPGNFRGSPGNFGEVWEPFGEPLDCC